MKKLISFLALFLMMGYVYANNSNLDLEEVEKHIRWLVPDDGKINGLAHDYLVNLGTPAGELIIQHVFKQPMIFFDPLENDAEVWLYGTQANAARVLAEMDYKAGLPVLREYYDKGVPLYLKVILKDCIEMLEKDSKD